MVQNMYLLKQVLKGNINLNTFKGKYGWLGSELNNRRLNRGCSWGNKLNTEHLRTKQGICSSVMVSLMTAWSDPKDINLAHSGRYCLSIAGKNKWNYLVYLLQKQFQLRQRTRETSKFSVWKMKHCWSKIRLWEVNCWKFITVAVSQ